MTIIQKGEPMNDLISRQAAIDALKAVQVEDDGTYNWRKQRNIDLEFAAELLETIPSAEPEIVRCGQCKYAEVADKEDVQDGYTCQFHRGSIWFSGSYCSWGERREE